MPDHDTGDSRRIAAVDKCCAILDATHELHGATLTEISEHLELTPGTVHPHLVTLVENQLVTKKNGVYAPSFKFLRIGEGRRQWAARARAWRLAHYRRQRADCPRCR